jgi:MurNAc alpha-1-phosphate uridylyltransferase
MKAMILAAGRGERLRPLTDHTPKPLMMAGAEPLIGWHLRRLKLAGITRLVINHAWLGDKLEQALGDGHAYGASIDWSREGVALETAGGIARALPLLGDEPFVVVNGDVLTDLDFSLLKQQAQKLDGVAHLAHLLLVDNPPHHPQGDFTLQANGQVSIDPALPGKRLTFAGIAAYHPVMFAALAQKGEGKAPLLPLLLPAMEQNVVSGEHFEGLWLDVGTPERLQEADRIARQWILP